MVEEGKRGRIFCKNKSESFAVGKKEGEGARKMGAVEEDQGGILMSWKRLRWQENCSSPVEGWSLVFKQSICLRT